MTSKQRFFVISDPQIGNDSQVRSMDIKKNIVLKNISPDDIIIIPGDLTDKGIGNVNNPFTLYFAYCACFRKPEDIPKENQLQILKDDYLNDLDTKCKDMFLCIGNHDTYTQKWWGEQDPAEYVKKRHGGLYYMKKCNNILIFSLSIYPNKKRTNWFKDKLAKTSEPFVVFFHYNLKGPYSDWWSDNEKDNFLTVLNKHKKRCVFIAEGHHHSSYFTHWNDFVVVNGANDSPILVDVETDQNNNIVKVDTKLLQK